MASSKEVLAAATPRAEDLFSRLLRSPFEDLVALPESDAMILDGYAKPVSLATFRELRANGEVQIVVQLAVAGILGSARFWVEGFRRSAHGEPVRLPQEDLYDFH